MEGNTAGMYKTIIPEQCGRTVMGRIQVPGDVQLQWGKIQGIAAATTSAAATGIPQGRHYGPNDDAKPDGATELQWCQWPIPHQC